MKQFSKYSWILEEIIYLTILAIPPSVASLTEGVHMKISNVFTGRTSGNNVEKMLSALFIGQIVTSSTSYPIFQGFAVYVNILCSQAYGAKQYKLMGLYFYKALFMAALTVFPLSALFISVGPIVYLLSQDWELSYHAGSYTSTFCLGLPAYFYFKIALSFLQSQHIVWPPLLYLFLGNIVNGIIQYVLIVHYNTNLAGAAGGYVISLYLMALLLYAHIRFTRVHILTHVSWSVEMISEWYHTVRYTLFPILQFFTSIFGSGTMSLILLGLVFQDTTQIAIFTVLYSLWCVFSLFASGFGSAVTVRVGNLLGANEPKKAFRAAIFSLFFCESVLLFVTLALFFSSPFLSHLFTTDPTFADNLIFNIRCMCFIIMSDIDQSTQGIMNACCMQGIQALIKIFLQTILSIILSIILTKFVWWKAVSIFVSNGIGSILCSLVVLVIISCRNWKRVALKVTENTQIKGLEKVLSERSSILKHSHNCNDRKLCNSTYKSTLFNLARYCFCFLLGILMFIVAASYQKS